MFANEYIEKIVQKPIPLPAIEQDDIDRFLDINIAKLFKEINIDQDRLEKFDKDFSYIYQTQIRKLFRTLRQAKRYLNGMRSTLPPIKSEVNLHDFFILEVIRMYYPAVYSDIWRNPWAYIPFNWSDSNYFVSPFGFALEEEDSFKQIKDHITALIRVEKETRVLMELLKSIFFVTVKDVFGIGKTDHTNVASIYRREQRITHPKCFKKYFMLRVTTAEISDDFIETTLRSLERTSQQEMEKVIKETLFELQKRNSLLGFIKELMAFIDRVSGPVALALIIFIYKNAGKFSKEGTENLWNSEYDKAESLLLRLINDRIDKKEIQNVLKEVVMQTEYLPFAVRVIASCKKERGGSLFNIYDSVEVKDFQNVVDSRLKKYFIDEKRNIFEVLDDERELRFVLYQWATNWGDFGRDNKYLLNNYIKSIVNNNAQTLIKFLRIFISSDDSDKLFFNFEYFTKVFKSEEFAKIASDFKSNSQVGEEELKLLNIFLEAASPKKTKILYYDPSDEKIGPEVSKKGWEIVQKEGELKKIKDYDVAILFLHEKAGKGMDEGLVLETQNNIIDYVANGGNLIAFHDVLFSRNRILSDKLCGHFKSPLGGKKDDVEIIVKEKHSINQNFYNFSVKDEGWRGAIPKVDSGEKLVILFVNQKDEPVIWLREYEKGEVLVISLGHSSELIENENIQKIVDNAIIYFTSKKGNF